MMYVIACANVTEKDSCVNTKQERTEAGKAAHDTSLTAYDRGGDWKQLC